MSLRRAPMHMGMEGESQHAAPNLINIDSPQREIIKHPGAENLSILVWTLKQNVPVNPKHTVAVDCCAFSPNGKTFVSGDHEGTIKLWDVSGNTPKEKGALMGHKKNNPMCTCWVGPERRWYKFDLLCPVKGHRAFVFCVAFSPDGKTLASGSGDNTVKLWGVETKQCNATLEGHVWQVTSVAFSPDGKTLASSSVDHTIKLWEVETKQCNGTLTEHSRHVNRVVFSPDGKTLASCSSDKTIKLWNVQNKTCKVTLRGHTKDNPECTCAHLEPSRENNFTKIVANPSCPATGHWGSVGSLAFSHDGKTLASGSLEDTVKLWDVSGNTPKLKDTFKQSQNWKVRSVAFSPDDKTLVSTYNEKAIKLWDVSGNKPKTRKKIAPNLKCTLMLPKRITGRVVISPDGMTLASGSEDGTIRLWKQIDKDFVSGWKKAWFEEESSFPPEIVKIIFDDDNGFVAW